MEFGRNTGSDKLYRTDANSFFAGAIGRVEDGKDGETPHVTIFHSSIEQEGNKKIEGDFFHPSIASGDYDTHRHR